MAFDRFYVTNYGAQYLAMVQSGSKLVITKVQIGTGFLTTGQTAVSRTALISYLKDCPIQGKQVSGNNVNVTVQFVNTDGSGNMLDPFWWGEVGLFAKLDNDANHPEILFAYANAMDQAHADYIPATLTEFLFVMSLNVQNAADNVSVQITAPVLYTPKISGGVAGNFASVAADGSFADSGKKAADFAGAMHSHNYAGSSTPGGDATNALALAGKSASQFATLSGAEALTGKTYNGYTLGEACAKSVDSAPASGSSNLVSSGGVFTALAGKAAASHAHVMTDITGLGTALAGKAAIVSGATGGNLAGLDASGNLTDSGKKPADFAASVHTHNYAGSVSAGGDAANSLALGGVAAAQYVTLSGTQALAGKTYNGYTLGAACAKGVDAAPASGSGNLITSDGVFTALAGKAAASHTHAQADVSGLVSALAGKASVASGATSGDLAALDASGNLTDSGKKIADLAAATHTHDAAALVSGALAMARGGTGASDRAAASYNLHFGGTNIDFTDTPANWPSGMEMRLFNSSDTMLTDKPSASGILIHSKIGSEVSQLWFTQGGGAIYHRQGSASAWSHSWRVMYDSASTIPVSGGGTGATTASGALANLGAAAAGHTHNYAGSASAGGDATNALSLGGVAAASYATLTGTQALSNKTYNGYTLGAACAKAVDTTPANSSANLITSGGVYTALAGKAAASHTHAMADVTGLDTALAGKAAASHTHAQADITGLDTALAGKAAASHTHAQADISGLSTALAGKASIVSNPVSGNFAGLDSSGNITDSGKKSADFATAVHSHSYAGSASAGGDATNALALGGVAPDQYVTLTGTQALSNKTYNGYTLGAACAKSVDTSPASSSANLITSGGVFTALASKADASHTHAQADITGLDTALAGKAAASHTHATADVTGLDTALAGKAAASHTHAMSDVSGLDTALAGKASLVASPVSGNFAGLNSSGNLTDSGKKAADFAAAVHTHNYAGSSSAGGDATNALSLGGVAAAQYATLTGTQSLTNKTINGYTLGAACAKAVDTTPTSGSANVITSGGVYTALAGKAAASHTHDVSQVTGIRPVSGGGTGASTALAALNNLGIFYAATLPTTGTEGQICLVPIA